MSRKTLLSIGECMLELSGAEDAVASGEHDLWRLGIAGDTLNTAWYARALLDPEIWQVAYFTRVGQDGFSRKIIDFIAANGIDTRWIGRDPHRHAGLYAIELKEGERSFTYWRDQSAARLLADDEASLEHAMDEADAIYLSGITLAILAPERRDFVTGLLAKASAKGKLTAFDPNIRPRLWPDPETARAAIMAAATASQLVLPSFDDEIAAFGDASPQETLERYRQAGAREVAVKNGGEAATIGWDGRTGTVSAGGSVTIVDTTGAGDSFNGGYLAARLDGADPLAAARAGHAIAGKVVGHRGALMPMDAVGRNSHSA
ncbi:MAG: sugar kinase [Nitratireductor sp.]|nr:sugar kinase [Nitratireductor sp.]